MVGINAEQKATLYTIVILLFALVVVWNMPTTGLEEETVDNVQKVFQSDDPKPNIDGKHHPLQYSQEDLDNMTQALYFEAQNEPLECQAMVAHVVMARKYDWFYPNTIKDVIWQPKQFSYTHDGKLENMDDDLGGYVASMIAHYVLSGLSLDSTEGSLYYHNPKLVDWEYKDDYTFVTRCGNHDFYKRKETKKWS
jgi:N-acetylmuramoyl-L-alanine amidase